jgi:hypothetical protein
VASALKGRAPFSRRQQKLIFALAAKGVPWAQKKVRDDRTMKVQPKGAPAPTPDPRYDKSKRELASARGRRGASRRPRRRS